MAKVEIYTATFCKFCSRAMRLLSSKEVSVEEIDITWGGPKRDEMLKRANGRTSVPQVFINDVHIGGSDDLAALERAGELNALLTS
jgi:glutaredoxin 3